MQERYYLLSLGCPKNEVDAEVMTTRLEESTFQFTPHPSQADFLIVNTCAFIDAAKKEAIEAILDLAAIKEEQKARGREVYLLVTGCLAQRYAEEIYHEFPEVDSVLGTREYGKIVERCKALKQRAERICTLPAKGDSLAHLKKPHKASADRSYAYLKIAEGCSNACAFCAIPSIRGGMKSRPIEELVEEARSFAEAGFKEQILIAQDSSRYGQDLYGEPSLPKLLRELVKVPGLERLRLMYVYGDSFSDELIELMQQEPKILRYIDLPVQHASDRILTAMRRRETRSSLEALITKLRSALPGLILRTTVMVGFPGETDEDFQELLEFTKKMAFDRLGCFTFCPEEGTLAAGMKDQVDPAVAQARYEAIMSQQQGISRKANEARIGQICDILLEGISEDGIFFTGRSYGEAPDIDPVIRIAAQAPGHETGELLRCRIVAAGDYELTAVSLEGAYELSE